jgi:hypothetical protein
MLHFEPKQKEFLKKNSGTMYVQERQRLLTGRRLEFPAFPSCGLLPHLRACGRKFGAIGRRRRNDSSMNCQKAKGTRTHLGG